MRFSDLKGQQVVAVQDASTVGTVDDALLDLPNQRITALQVSLSGLFTGHRDLLWSDIQSIGENAVTIASDGLLRDPKNPALAALPNTGAVFGLKMLTENGTKVGSVEDIDFDPASGQITGYVLAEGLLARLKHETRTVATSSVRSVGNDQIVVANAVVQEEEEGG